MPVITETRWDLIVSNDELDIAAIPRAKEYIEKRVNNSEKNLYLSNGYTIKKEGINKSTLIKVKKPYDAFEDEVWTIFYKMGFYILLRTIFQNKLMLLQLMMKHVF